MNISCDVVLDLIPLVKDHIASEDSINLVSKHLEGCQSCKHEFESHSLSVTAEFDDKRVVSSIKKKLFLASSALLLLGAVIGMALNKNSSSNLFPAIIIVLGITFIGIALFKFDLKGDLNVKRFFIGRAIGTIIIFGLLGIYLLFRYVLSLF